MVQIPHGARHNRGRAPTPSSAAERRLGVALQLCFGELGVPDVAVTVKLYVVSAGEHLARQLGLREYALADHEERRRDPAAPSCSSTSGVQVGSGPSSKVRLRARRTTADAAGAAGAEPAAGGAAHGRSWYSRRNPSNRRRWPSSSWRIAITMSLVTGSDSSVASMISL